MVAEQNTPGSDMLLQRP